MIRWAARSPVAQAAIRRRSTDRLGLRLTSAADRDGGQAHAEEQGGARLRHGVSRALLTAEPDLRPTLKAAGFLTRDPRKKERKKYGQKGARARFQFSKR